MRALRIISGHRRKRNLKEASLALAGRTEELARLEELLDDAVRGSGNSVTIRGVVGCGKTALLHAFAARAAARGVTVLTAAGSRAERALPLGVLSQLLNDVPGDDAPAASVRRLLDRAMAAVRPDSAGGAAEQARIMRELWLAVHALARERPLLIGVDDVQHADEASLRYLLYFVRRINGARIAFVFTEWDHPRRIHPVTDLDLLRQHHCHRLRLAPLDQEAVAVVAAAHLPASDAERLAPVVHELSGGNPLLATALVEDARRGPAPPPGDAYRVAVLTCLHRGEPVGLRVARALAVLDGPPPAPDGAPAPGTDATELVHELAGVDRVTAAHCVDVLNATGVLRAGRFRHAAAREAVLADMDEDERVRLRSRAAELLHARGAPATAVAAHLVAAGTSGGRWGIDVLAEAAERALLGDDPHLARGCLRLAAQDCADARRRADLTMMLVHTEWRTNPGAIERYAPALTTALYRGNLRSADAHTVVRALFWQGKYEHALSVLPWLGPGAGGDPGEKVERRITDYWLACFFPPFVTGRELEHPAAITRRPGKAQAVAAMYVVLTRGPDEEAARAAEQYLQSTRLDDDTLQAVQSALMALMYVDAARAAFWCDSAIEEAGRRGASSWRAVLRAVRSEIAVRQGDLPAALSCATAALADMPRRSWGVTVGTPLSSLVLAATRMGAHDTAAAEVRRHLPDAIFQTRFGLQVLDARGHHHLATGCEQAALGDFLRCGELATRWGVDLPTYPQWRLGAAEAALAVGDHRQARKLVREQLAGPAARDRRVRGATLRVQAALSRPQHRPAVLREAVALLRDSGDQYELALALTDLSEAHRALGELSRAQMFRDGALTLAEACGAAPLLARLGAGGAGDGRGNGPDAEDRAGGADARLSDAEYRVASLAAVGYQNREIADELRITVSTVEQHLTRTYKKLKVPGRAGLAGRLPAVSYRQAATQAATASARGGRVAG